MRKIDFSKIAKILLAIISSFLTILTFLFLFLQAREPLLSISFDQGYEKILSIKNNPVVIGISPPIKFKIYHILFHLSVPMKKSPSIADLVSGGIIEDDNNSLSFGSWTKVIDLKKKLDFFPYDKNKSVEDNNQFYYCLVLRATNVLSNKDKIYTILTSKTLSLSLFGNYFSSDSYVKEEGTYSSIKEQLNLEKEIKETCNDLYMKFAS